jgi:hypothetical protein
MVNAEQLEARSAEYRKKSFQAFLETPSTRLMLSMVPPSENREVLTTLLDECFRAAWNGGTSTALVILLQEYMRGPNDHNRKPPLGL